MKSLTVLQGSDEWLEIRGKYHVASEAPVMQGAAKHTKRSELVRMTATGDKKEFSKWFEENILDKGHNIEAAARPIAENLVEGELYPVTGINEELGLLASFDGITMLEDVVWECKSFNKDKAAKVRAGEIPPEDKPQVIQQLAVSGAEKALYMVTDGTEENTVHCWYSLQNGDVENLLAHWRQFDDDVASYEHTEAEFIPTGKAPESLPALRIEVTGMVTASNLAEFKGHALSVIGGINKDLQTDSDFADAEKTVKWLGDVESRLDAAKEHALSQTASIDELFKALDDIKENARRTRLDLDKLVKARKEARKSEIQQEGIDAYRSHIDALNTRLERVRLPEIPADFAGAMKNKRTIASLKDAVSVELARVKIESSQMADKMEVNLKLIDAAGHPSLFSDKQQLVLLETAGLKEIIAARIAHHETEEKRRLDAERGRIRQEEQAKAAREAAVAQAEDAHGAMMAEAKSHGAVPAEKPRVRQQSSKARPSDQALVATIASAYNVPADTVVEWLKSMNFAALAA